jgi:arylsulfatase A-like enzyme
MKLAKRIVQSAIQSCLVLVVYSAAVHAAQDRPNIVYVMADDMGFGDVKCFGGARCLIETPHMDALANSGMRFTDAHSVASVCVPSRVAIMTGRYPWRTRGSRPSGPWGFLNPRLTTTDFTLGKMLRSAGYRTGYVGKWHLGTLMPTLDGKNQAETNVDYSKPIKFGPNDFGFDSSFILPGSLDMYPYVFNKDRSWVGQVTAQRGWSAFNRVGPAAADFEDYKVLDAFSSQAEDFIARNAQASKRGKPFFLYVALTSPHTPTSPRPEFRGKSKLGVYGDFVMETDDCVGRVMQALEKHGLSKNTLFIATSDHGPASYAGNILKATPGQIHALEEKGHYPSGRYRGYKFSVYEGGNRIPLIVRWPNVVAAKSTCDRLVGLNDLMATLADAVGIKLNPNQAVDSISYLPLLKQPDSQPTRQTMILQSTSVFVVRSHEWKLCVCPGSGALGRYGNVPTPTDAWNAAIKEFGRHPKNNQELKEPAFVQLFNLKNDPTESDDLSASRPKLVKELFAILDARVATGRSTPGPQQKNGVDRVNIHNRVPAFVWNK